MDAELERICFEMISLGGDARAMVFEALSMAREGDIVGARQKIEQSRQPMTAAHKVQMRLLQKEANGETVGNAVLLVHAQDILMASVTERDLSELIVALFERVQTLEKGK